MNEKQIELISLTLPSFLPSSLFFLLLSLKYPRHSVSNGQNKYISNGQDKYDVISMYYFFY